MLYVLFRLYESREWLYRFRKSLPPTKSLWSRQDENSTDINQHVSAVPSKFVSYFHCYFLIGCVI